MSKNPIIVWFRQDLRVSDNPALDKAIKSGRPIIALYIREEADLRPLGGASKWFVHHALQSLSKSLGQKLVLRSGSPLEIILSLVKEFDVDTVYWNRRYESHEIKLDAEIKENLAQAEITCESFNSHLLFEPWAIKNKSGNPYKVFTPFWQKGCLASDEPPAPLLAGKKLNLMAVGSEQLTDWDFLPKPLDWSAGFSLWKVSEAGAKQRLDHFLKEKVKDYKKLRDFPAEDSTSMLSPYLRW